MQRARPAGAVERMEGGHVGTGRDVDVESFEWKREWRGILGEKTEMIPRLVFCVSERFWSFGDTRRDAGFCSVLSSLFTLCV